MRHYRRRKKLLRAPSPLRRPFKQLLRVPLQDPRLRMRGPGIWQLLPSLLGVGYLPLMPGTWGSLATLGVCYALHPRLSIGSYIWMIVSVFVIGTALVIVALSHQIKPDDDPPHIVIDEAVGQMIAILPLFYEPLWWPLSFLFFRFFDIKKPLLVSWPQMNLHGAPVATAFGIMLDDVMAGVYAGGLSFAVYTLVDFIYHV